MTFIDVGVGTPEERRVSIVNDGDRGILAIGVPTGEPDRFTFTGAYMTRHTLMVLIANLTEVAYALPSEAGVYDHWTKRYREVGTTGDQEYRCIDCDVLVGGPGRESRASHEQSHHGRIGP